jgi:hypothetical protein
MSLPMIIGDAEIAQMAIWGDARQVLRCIWTYWDHF